MSLTSYRTAPPRGRSDLSGQRTERAEGRRAKRGGRGAAFGPGCEARRDDRATTSGDGQAGRRAPPLRAAPPRLRAPGAARQGSANGRGRADRRVRSLADPGAARRTASDFELCPSGRGARALFCERRSPRPGLATPRSPILGRAGRPSEPSLGAPTARGSQDRFHGRVRNGSGPDARDQMSARTPGSTWR